MSSVAWKWTGQVPSEAGISIMLNVEDCPHHWVWEGVDTREEEILLVPITIKLEMKARCCAMQKQHLCSNPGRREGGEGSEFWCFTRAWKETWVWMGRLEQQGWALLGDHHACSSWLILHLCLHELLEFRFQLEVLFPRASLFNLYVSKIPVEAAMNNFLL